MFEDSLFESSATIRTHRSATTAASVMVQCLLLGAAVLAPLIYTEALPSRQMIVDLLPLPPRGAPPAPRTQEPRQRPSAIRSEMAQGHILLPGPIPIHATEIHDPASMGDIISSLGDAVLGGTGGPGRTGVPDGILSPRPAVAPRFEPSARLNISGGVTLGHLIQRVEPVYPEIAIRARIQGDVLLHAVIGRDGAIQKLNIVSGHPMLARAAIDAVSHWRYQPFLLSGQPVEVETEVTVRFRLGS